MSAGLLQGNCLLCKFTGLFSTGTDRTLTFKQSNLTLRSNQAQITPRDSAANVKRMSSWTHLTNRHNYNHLPKEPHVIRSDCGVYTCLDFKIVEKREIRFGTYLACICEFIQLGVWVSSSDVRGWFCHHADGICKAPQHKKTGTGKPQLWSFRRR